MPDTLHAPLPPAQTVLAAHPVLDRLDGPDRLALTACLERVAIPPGQMVVHEGEADRSLYLVLDGEARARREGFDIGSIGAGDHFGELGLVLGQPRKASVQAVTGLEVLRLGHARYALLRQTDPALAVRLLEALVGGVGHRLEEMTESVGMLLRERSLPRRAEVRVRTGGHWQTVRTGTRVGALLPAQLDGHAVVAALLDRRIVPLSWPLSSQSTVEPLTTLHPEGQAVLRHSIALLVLEAAWRFDPGLRVSMGYSVGFGRRIEVEGVTASGLEALARELETRAHALARSGVLAREEWWTVEEAREHFADRGWSAAVDLLRTWHLRTVPLCSYGELYALSLGPLVEDARLLNGFRVLAEAGGLLLQYPPRAASRGPTLHRRDRAELRSRTEAELRAVSRQTADMTSPQEKWLSALGVRSVGTFNDACVGGDVAQMIRVAEGFQEKRIIDIAERLRAHRDARIVCIAGPSSSGKTTFISRLNVQLQVCGLRPVGLSLDDYYVDRDLNPRDENGEYDFEAFEALRLDLLREHMGRLLAGERVTTARYDFPTGRSHPNGGPAVHLGEDEVLLLEGIHGLNPQLLPEVAPHRIFTIFVCPLAQLPFDRLSRVSASDVRLLRRIVRDRHGRNHDAASTIQRWPSVRAGERKHIFPYQHLADAVFDSSLLYELSVLKVFAQRYLLEVPQGHEAYATAARLLGLLDRFVTIYPDHVPPTSILREFIGSGAHGR